MIGFAVYNGCYLQRLKLAKILMESHSHEMEVEMCCIVGFTNV